MRWNQKLRIDNQLISLVWKAKLKPKHEEGLWRWDDWPYILLYWQQLRRCSWNSWWVGSGLLAKNAIDSHSHFASSSACLDRKYGLFWLQLFVKSISWWEQAKKLLKWMSDLRNIMLTVKETLGCSTSCSPLVCSNTRLASTS